MRLFMLVSAILLVSLVSISPALAQEKTDPKGADGTKAAEKSEKKESKGGFFGFGKKDDESKAAEQAQKYADLRGKAQAKFKDPSNLDFKNRVLADLKEKRREHSEYAFRINTLDSKDERVTFTGDKLTSEDTLYDNQLVQDYINRLGQSLVPPSSKNRFAFKVVMNPIPDARSISTGTVYVSTGLISLIDTEAQLAYVLAHEIAHIEKEHWMDDSLVFNQLLDERRARDNTFKFISLATFGLMAGRSIAQDGNVVQGLIEGSVMGYGTYALLKFVSSIKTFSWDSIQEKEADQMALRLIFDRNYDPREVPKLYARMKSISEREPRISDSFLARTERISESVGMMSSSIASLTVKEGMFRGSSNLRARRSAESVDTGLVSPLEAGKPFGTTEDAEKREKEAGKGLQAMEAELKVRVERGEIIGSGPEFETAMSDLKRDNGVRAFYYDMFAMSLQNLREAMQIRSDDPYTAFYFGKVLQLVARTPAEKAEAMQAFVNAINLDKRGTLPGPWLHRAIGLMGDRNPSQTALIVDCFHKYVEIYQQEHSGDLPANMDAIYEYLKALGDDTWVARPVQNVSTRNIGPLDVVAPSATSRVSGGKVAATEPEAPKPATPDAPAKAGKPESDCKTGPCEGEKKSRQRKVEWPIVRSKGK